MKELRQPNWLDMVYNIILMGPSGTGKTFIAGGLIYEAVKSGKKVYMLTTKELTTIIKMNSISQLQWQTTTALPRPISWA